MNSTICPLFHPNDPLCFSRPNYPFYYSPKRQLVDSVPDTILTLASPIVAYWGLSLIFHCLDISDWKWLDKYRIHDSEEVKSKNLVTKTQVVWAVVFQQIIQTALGLIVLEEERPDLISHPRELRRLATYLQPILTRLTMTKVEVATLANVTECMYWWGIPCAQFFAAMFIIDTWQYFLHRWMHVNKFLYRHFHSWHHRLYVPYAFGSLYNHPVEGFLLDTLGALVAETLTFMTTRQAMVLFSFSSMKTVDDHCGYNLPWDPLQMMSGNNADYHDIHHQIGGIKSNFAQPFFIHWDTILGTRMTREELRRRKEKSS